MKEYVQIEFVSATQIEVNDIHDTVSLLEQVEGLLPLLSFYKLYCGIV